MTTVSNWVNNVIKEDEIDRYLNNGKDFIDDDKIIEEIKTFKNSDKSKIREIIKKAEGIETLTPEETACLLNVEDEDLWEEIYQAGARIKHSVYDNRIVTFAPLYCSNLCVNNCEYCGFKNKNSSEKRKILSREEILNETENLIKMGHKRLIMVYGEHPESDADYIINTMKDVYSVKVESQQKVNQIRRVNINAAPMCIDDLKRIKDAGIGTFQVFQETYHHESYKKYHPSTIKANYRWRLYALHRALEAGIDDMGAGALFGLYDWKFEVMAMVYHAHDLEQKFGIGPHTISFPRITPASDSKVFENNPYVVNDKDFKKLVAVLRLSIPYSGMIITARESAEVRREIIPIGCTQTDASTRIGVGAYSEQYNQQEKERQQFMLGDTRNLEEVIREFADRGIITSFCTAGYRCGRTGDKIMGLLKSGEEGKFCKLNAILTFKEWLMDYASEETQKIGDKLIEKEFKEIAKDPFFRKHKLDEATRKLFDRISAGERDLYI